VCSGLELVSIYAIFLFGRINFSYSNLAIVTDFFAIVEKPNLIKSARAITNDLSGRVAVL